MRPSECLTSLLLFTAASSAWSSGWGDLMGNIAPIMQRQHLEERQDETTRTSFNLHFTGVQGDTATLTKSNDDSTSSPTSDSESKATGTGTGKDASSQTRTGTAKETGTDKSGTRTSQQNTKTFDPRLPAGGVSMITPNALTSSYFKIADYITFAWNYTSLSVTPSYIDVLASCSLNQETYTIAMNHSVQETQTIVWDTGKYQATGTVPLLTETYTLIIHDAAKDVSAMPSAGYLGTYNQFTFGMYTPQPYTPISDYVCATCNSAMTQMERQTVWAIFAMVGVTVMSFGWFTGVAGLW